MMSKDQSKPEKPYHLTSKEIEALRLDSIKAIDTLMAEPEEESMKRQPNESGINTDKGLANQKSVEDLLREGKLGKGGSEPPESETAQAPQSTSSEDQRKG